MEKLKNRQTFTMAFPVEILKWVASEAEKIGVSRSQYFLMAMKQHKDAVEGLKMYSDLSLIVNEIKSLKSQFDDNGDKPKKTKKVISK